MKKLLVKLMLAMPERWLISRSGGKALEIAGRRLDPRIQFLGAMAAKQPGLDSVTPEIARIGAAENLGLVDGKAERGVQTNDIRIPRVDGSSIGARMYKTRNSAGALPTLVYYHMGGCVIGDIETCHVFCALLAKRAGCLVISVDYALAPEHKYPASVDDAMTAYRWARANAQNLGGDPARIAVGGDSAGGYLSAVVAQECLRQSEPAPRVQLLIYPVVDWFSPTASLRDFKDAYPLTTVLMDWFRDHYFNDPATEARELRGSPGLSTALSGLPAALVYTAGHDPLVDQGEQYARALERAGVPVLYRCYDHLAHAFTAMSGAIPAARGAIEDIADDLKRALS